jgi:hypothetical protein
VFGLCFFNSAAADRDQTKENRQAVERRPIKVIEVEKRDRKSKFDAKGH